MYGVYWFGGITPRTARGRADEDEPAHYYFRGPDHLCFRAFYCRYLTLDDHQRTAFGYLSGPDPLSKTLGRDTLCPKRMHLSAIPSLFGLSIGISGRRGSPNPAIMCRIGPIWLGTERTGPDLSQEGGEHPDDWHLAHFTNPRFVRPESIMPSWQFLGKDNIKALIAYKQSLGFKMADFRVERQKKWKEKAVKAYEAGPDENIQWLHQMVPEPWRKLPNPYPTTRPGWNGGIKFIRVFCIGCHGPIGDGMGPAEPYLNPPPLNFTLLNQRGISGGILYHQIMEPRANLVIDKLAMAKANLEKAKSAVAECDDKLRKAQAAYNAGTNAPNVPELAAATERA